MKETSNKEPNGAYEWLLRATVQDTRINAPKSATQTLRLALAEAIRISSKGRIETLQKELFNRLEPGDKVVLSDKTVGELFMKDRFGMLLSQVPGLHKWREIVDVIPRAIRHVKN